MKPQYLTAKEVTAELDISFGTLYSYVSRGLIRSEETNSGTRHKRYWAEDVAALRNRKEQRRNPTTSAATALDFGDPVLESAITRIENGRLYYREHSAVELARTQPLEAVAGLLWHGRLQPELSPLPAQSDVVDRMIATLLPALPKSLTPVERFHALLPVAEAQDLAAHDRTAAGVSRTAGRIYSLFLTALLGQAPQPGISVAEQLALWRTNHVAASAASTLPASTAGLPEQDCWPELFNAALILCADHELNVSSFTARCVASANATPYGAVAAALAALQGPRHGGDTARCEALIRDAQTDARQALAAWLRRGERLPGFDHRLYPQGDPRAAALLDLLRTRLGGATQNGMAHYSPTPAILQSVQDLIEQVAATFGLRPTIDLALACLAMSAQLPPGSALTLFTAGRIIGWIAHVLEQYQTDTLIRPRARFKSQADQPDSLDSAGAMQTASA